MRIAALLTLLLCGLTCAVRADEYGPHPAIRAIRAALPVLLAAGLKSPAGPVRVPDIVVDGDAAIASWDAGKESGLALLSYRPNGWWMTAGVAPPPHLRDLATAHIPAMARDDGLLTPLVTTLAGYRTSWTGSKHGSGAAPSDFTFRDRAPTVSEMPPSRGADAVYFFTLQSKATQNVSVTAGSTLDVWAPFVLDPRLHYTLTLALGDPTIGPLEGTLSDNTMHFILPAFSAPPSVDLMGEIDGDP